MCIRGLNACMLTRFNTLRNLTQYLYDPGISPGSAYQCVLGNLYLRSDVPSNACMVHFIVCCMLQRPHAVYAIEEMVCVQVLCWAPCFYQCCQCSTIYMLNCFETKRQAQKSTTKAHIGLQYRCTCCFASHRSRFRKHITAFQSVVSICHELAIPEGKG